MIIDFENTKFDDKYTNRIPELKVKQLYHTVVVLGDASLIEYSVNYSVGEYMMDNQRDYWAQIISEFGSI